MISIAGINGHVVYKSNIQVTNKLTKSRKVFLTNLALELLQKRAVNQHLSRDARKTACRLTQIPLQDSRTAPSANRKRGKCFYCRNHNTRYFLQEVSKMALLGTCSTTTQQEDIKQLTQEKLKQCFCDDFFVASLSERVENIIKTKIADEFKEINETIHNLRSTINKIHASKKFLRRKMWSY
nr:unnamed protein product [Callosobruchus analis]